MIPNLLYDNQKLKICEELDTGLQYHVLGRKYDQVFSLLLMSVHVINLETLWMRQFH